ncbi:SEC6 [Candida pseudojiufengensis]|uniref:SEC6 n=1 Tax=Candida pseudojiufengensis TaxID=497109 RepID=UPI00222488DF|nr:SEC6 [Candida pseudojiufengensis]KAI5959089.1 SEC6 [Candida pseudojiufengensis]
MSDIALSKIGGLIKTEDDLSKIELIRQQFAKEKSAIDVKLSTSTQLQIDSIRDNVAQLDNTMKKMIDIKGSVSKIKQIHNESITSVKDYEIIRKMTTINQSLNQISSLYNDIKNLKPLLKELNTDITKEYESINNDLLYPLPNLLLIHYRYTQIRNFQDYLEFYTKSLSDDLRSIVLNIISNVKDTIKLFDELLNECIMSITETARDNNYSCLYNVIGIIIWEDQQDIKLDLMNDLSLAKSDINQDYKNFRSKKRNYKRFFFEKFKISLESQFNECINFYSNDKIALYDNLQWLEEEIIFIHQILDPLFPKNWKIDEFVQKVYYDKLHNFTMEMINLEPPAEDILRILSYDKKFETFIKQCDGKTTSIIGEDLKNSVLEDYLKSITTKMKEWNESLIKQETKFFTERNKAPDVYPFEQTIEEEDNFNNITEIDIQIPAFVLPDFKTPLNMLKQQADVAAESQYSKILVEVIESWCQCTNIRMENFKIIIDEENDRYFTIFNNEKFLINQSKAKRLFTKKPTVVNVDELTPEEQRNISREGLIEYLVALANSLEISNEIVNDKFKSNYLEKVHSNYHQRISTAFENTTETSIELSIKISNSICKIIINDLYPELGKLFSKKWLEDGQKQTGEIMMASLISETIAEYMREVRSYSVYTIYKELFQLLLDNFVCSYLKIGFENILYGDGKKINPETTGYKSFASRIRLDAELIFEGLQDLFTKKDLKYLFTSLSAIEKIGDLSTCPDPMHNIPAIWSSDILPVFYDCSIDYIKAIVYCRKDMEKSQWKELEPKLIELKKQYHSEVESPNFAVLTLDNFEINI